jgi:hypothetical protein
MRHLRKYNQINESIDHSFSESYEPKLKELYEKWISLIPKDEQNEQFWLADIKPVFDEIQEEFDDADGELPLIYGVGPHDKYDTSISIVYYGLYEAYGPNHARLLCSLGDGESWWVAIEDPKTVFSNIMSESDIESVKKALNSKLDIMNNIHRL